MNKENCELKLVDEIILTAHYSHLPLSLDAVMCSK